MGESKRITDQGRAARAAAVHADAVEATKDRMRAAVDGFANMIRWRMAKMTPADTTVALGTAVGIFAASAGGATGAEAIASRVDEVARKVIEQAGEAA